MQGTPGMHPLNHHLVSETFIDIQTPVQQTLQVCIAYQSSPSVASRRTSFRLNSFLPAALAGANLANRPDDTKS